MTANNNYLRPSPYVDPFVDDNSTTASSNGAVQPRRGNEWQNIELNDMGASAASGAGVTTNRDLEAGEARSAARERWLNILVMMLLFIVFTALTVLLCVGVALAIQDPSGDKGVYTYAGAG